MNTNLAPQFALQRLQTRFSWWRSFHGDAELPADLADALWHSPQTVMAKSEPLRKVGVRSTVRLNWGDRQFVIKHYVEPTFRHTLKQTVTRSRAWRTWSTAHRLADAGVATPRPVACLENRFGPFRGDSYLMYPYVEGCTLRSYLGCEEPAGKPVIEAIREQLVEFWSRLKQLRVSLADTNLQNFIVGDAGRLWVIDVDKARFHRVAYLASRHHERAWTQLTRSARRTGDQALEFVDGLRGRL